MAGGLRLVAVVLHDVGEVDVFAHHLTSKQNNK
jgi:hypothetical protein